ncbi:zf-HC2 domain-containing protein [Actinomadura madurae]|nr:zf-HC2 domain-containing protein [Actinomadura madurae]
MGIRAVRTFAVESLRFRREDARWLLRWPAAAWTGRFARHDGHFDPGQRIANVLLVAGLLVLIGTGAGMATLHGGPVFAVLVRVHEWATYACTVLIAGHVLVASGVLPGYRGVWRSMHLGGGWTRGWPGGSGRAGSNARGAARAGPAVSCPSRTDAGAYVLGVLPPGDRSRMRAHLEGCAPCRAEIADLAPVAGLLRSLVLRGSRPAGRAAGGTVRGGGPCARPPRPGSAGRPGRAGSGC